MIKCHDQDDSNVGCTRTGKGEDCMMWEYREKACLSSFAHAWDGRLV
jgi:hypothetical protein